MGILLSSPFGSVCTVLIYYEEEEECWIRWHKPRLSVSRLGDPSNPTDQNYVHSNSYSL